MNDQLLKAITDKLQRSEEEANHEAVHKQGEVDAYRSMRRWLDGTCTKCGMYFYSNVLLADHIEGHADSS